MTPVVGEFYLAKFRLKNCDDVRPCVVVEILEPDKILVGPLSSQFVLFNSHEDFEIQDQATAEFGATGLRRRCYIIGAEVVKVNTSILIKRLGQMTGFLDVQFREWYGL